MEMLSLDCPNCGAHLPPRDPSGEVTCEYCGARFHPSQARGARTMAGQAIDPRQLAHMIAAELRAKPPAPVVPQSYGPPPVSRYAPPPQVTSVNPARGLRWVMWVSILMGTCVPVAIGFVNSGLISQLPGLENIPGASQLVDSAERMTFDTVGGLPQPVTIAGKPGVIGRTRTVLKDDQLYVDGYTIEPFERAWRIGPLGDYSSAYQGTLFGALDDRVVVTDVSPKVQLHDIDTGELVSSHDLSDRAQKICVPPPGDKGHKVWIEQVDEKHHYLDVSTGELSEGKAPDWCRGDQWNAVPYDALLEEQVPHFDGFAFRQGWANKDVAVVLGVKQPGTAFPLVIGFDPRTKKKKWEEEVANVDHGSVRPDSAQQGALAGDRFVTVFGTGSEDWHATAFDAKTGKREWVTDMRGIFAVDEIGGIVGTADHAFIVRESSVEIYDASDGKLLGTIGTETYD